MPCCRESRIFGPSLSSSATVGRAAGRKYHGNGHRRLSKSLHGLGQVHRRCREVRTWSGDELTARRRGAIGDEMSKDAVLDRTWLVECLGSCEGDCFAFAVDRQRHSAHSNSACLTHHLIAVRSGRQCVKV